jgi:hypothetical protein
MGILQKLEGPITATTSFFYTDYFPEALPPCKTGTYNTISEFQRHLCTNMNGQPNFSIFNVCFQSPLFTQGRA